MNLKLELATYSLSNVSPRIRTRLWMSGGSLTAGQSRYLITVNFLTILGFKPFCKIVGCVYSFNKILGFMYP